MNEQTIDTLYVSDKLVIACLLYNMINNFLVSHILLLFIGKIWETREILLILYSQPGDT